jgi:hypothetical protein
MEGGGQSIFEAKERGRQAKFEGKNLRGKFCLATIPCIYIYNLTISWTVLTSNLLIEKEENTLNLNKFPPPPRSYSVLTHIEFETEREGA